MLMDRQHFFLCMRLEDGVDGGVGKGDGGRWGGGGGRGLVLSNCSFATLAALNTQSATTSNMKPRVLRTNAHKPSVCLSSRCFCCGGSGGGGPSCCLLLLLKLLEADRLKQQQCSRNRQASRANRTNGLQLGRSGVERSEELSTTHPGNTGLIA